jgi:hypothetical protein
VCARGGGGACDSWRCMPPSPPPCACRSDRRLPSAAAADGTAADGACSADWGGCPPCVMAPAGRTCAGHLRACRTAVVAR